MCCVLPDTVNATESRNKRKGRHNAGTASLCTLLIFPKPKRKVWTEPSTTSYECPETRTLHELSNTFLQKAACGCMCLLLALNS